MNGFQTMPDLLVAGVEVVFSHIITVMGCPATLIEGMVVRGKSLELTRCLQACRNFCWTCSPLVSVLAKCLPFTHSSLCRKGVLVAVLAPPALSALHQGTKAGSLEPRPNPSLLTLLLQALPPSRCSMSSTRHCQS